MHGYEEHERETRERGTASLVAVLGLFAMAMAVALVGLSVNQRNFDHSVQAREDLETYFVAVAGLNDAFAEAKQAGMGTGGDGVGNRAHGIGALGINTPISFTDSTGRVVGQYKAWVINEETADPVNNEPDYVIRVLAASPSFADARTKVALRARMGGVVTFALAPKPGAISVDGEVDTFALNNWNNPDFLVNGNGAPAFTYTHEGTFDNFIEQIDDNWDSGWGLDDNILGSPMVLHNEGAGNEFEAPIQLQNETSFTADQLNGYRDALRSYAEGLVNATPSGGGVTVDYDAAESNGVVVVHRDPTVGSQAGAPRIEEDHTYGTVAAPKTVLIDTGQFHQGGSGLTDNHDRTITGSGTLVILHPIGSKTDNANGKQFNLDWDGDVFVIGYPDDRDTGVGNNASTDNLLYISRTDWNINGNLVVLSAGDTEASLEMRGTAADPANLNITGSLLMFAEATGREAEIDIEGSANLVVNGIVGVYGSRAELENQDGGGGTTFQVNGTLAIGLPGNTSTSAELQVEGNAEFSYDAGNVQSAVEALAELQSGLTLPEDTPNGVNFTAHAWVTRGNSAFSTYETELATLVGAGTTDFGIDLNLVLNNATQ